MLPHPDEYAPHYSAYIKPPATSNIFDELTEQAVSFPKMLMALSSDIHNYRYQPDKWTVKEVVAHVIETERIMAYRALRISRNDPTPLAGFEQNSYVEQIDYSNRPMVELAAEFEAVRKSNLYLFRSFNEEQVLLKGVASGFPVSVRALLFIIAGHLRHHWDILEERYV